MSCSFIIISIPGICGSGDVRACICILQLYCKSIYYTIIITFITNISDVIIFQNIKLLLSHVAIVALSNVVLNSSSIDKLSMVDRKFKIISSQSLRDVISKGNHCIVIINNLILIETVTLSQETEHNVIIYNE